MTGELLLNEELIDLKPDTVIALTFAVSDVADVANRKGSGSNSFRVPKTQGNIQRLGHSDKISSLSTIAYEKIPARYSQKGIQIVKSGYGIISEVGEDFEIVIYDGNTPFFALIDKLKLQDLDFSALDHLWSGLNITSYITNTSDIIYPIVDYGQAPFVFLFGNRKIEVEFMLPWIFLKTVVDKIFEGTGYTYSGDFVQSALYENLIISLPTMKEDEVYLLAEATSSADSAFIGITGAIVLFDTEVSDPVEALDPPGLIVITTFTVYKAWVAGSYNFKFIINWETNATASGGYLEIQSTGGVIHHHVELAPNSTGTETVVVKNISMEIGDVCYAFVRGNIASGAVKVLAGSSMECIRADGIITYTKMFSISNNLPDISQKDLLKAFMQMYCILPITNTLTKNVYFVQFKEIINNKAYAADWTSKVDMSIEAKILLRAATYAQTNFLRYKEDDTITNDVGDPSQLGDGSFTIDDEVLELEKDLLTLPFAASEMISRYGGIDVAEYLRLNVTTLEWMDGTPRILILDKQDLGAGEEFYYTEPDGSATPNVGNENLAYFALDGKADNLKFSDNLISKHYSDFVAMLNSYKKVIVAMKLTAIDIEWWQFNQADPDPGAVIPVYLQQDKIKGYFFINQISQWISAETACLVELVKID